MRHAAKRTAIGRPRGDEQRFYRSSAHSASHFLEVSVSDSSPRRAGEGATDEDLDGARCATPVEAAEILSRVADVTLLAHVNPDADALGSALALATALRRRGAECRVSFAEPASTPPALAWLDQHDLIVAAEAIPEVPDTLVVLDSGSLQRVGGLADRVTATAEAGGDVVVIDHHVANTRFGTCHVLDESAEATALIVLRLLDALGAAVDADIARCLYAGLVTDTRSFRHAKAETHEVAARLVGTGLDPQRIARKLMDTHPFAWLDMLSRVLACAALEPAEAGGLGFVHATVPLAQSDGLNSAELDSVMDVVRTTAEAEVAAVLKETATDRWSVSLRADSMLDVGWAANECGGGGHRFASGFTANGTAEEVLRRLRNALARAPRGC